MSTDIAIVGLSVEVPDASDQHAFWEVVRSGRSLTRPFPAARRADVEEYLRYHWESALIPDAADGVAFHDGSFLDRIDEFDHEFFGMTPKQAAVTDPHQRLVLRTMYRALEDAGYVGDRLAGSRTGVFLGYAGNPGWSYLEYFCRIDPALGQLGITGNIVTMLANRLSYLFDLRGPSMVIDSACSASLLALHQAKNALLLGDCETAVVAGTRIVLAPVRHPHTRIGIESSDGATRTFDESADGTGFGEGSGAVVLKRLDRALADGDQVYAVIKGSAVNHDGRSGMMTAPDAGSQADLLGAAWRDAGVDPRTIGYLEVHGTATKVGDPVEFEGLRRAFAARTGDRGFCAVGTVKANVGHLFEGSGVLGVIKAALALRHRTIPPLANHRRPNTALDLANSPVYIPVEAREWAAGDTPRRAGVSAFGLGGTNAHVVLEEYTGPEPPASERPYVFTLSARTPASLDRLTARYREAIDAGRLTGAVRDVCWTSNVSRAGHRHRVAYRVRTLAELRAALDGPGIDDVPDDLLAQYDGEHPRTVHLPPYEFDETRAWVEFPDDWRDSFTLAAPRDRHPVTHEVRFDPVPPAVAGGGPATVVALTASDAVAAALPGAEIRPDLRTVAEAEDLVDAGCTHLVHALALDDRPAADAAELDERIRTQVHGLFLLAKALMDAGARLRLVVLTRRGLVVTPAEPGAVPEHALLAGLAKAIGREYPYLTVTLLDLDDAVPADRLRTEILAAGPGVFALRGAEKFGEAFAELPEIPAVRDEYLRPGGAYLITGGLGGIGLAIARHFAARQPGVRLFLMGRTARPVDVPGAEVVIADAGDEDQLASALAAIGHLDGIVHAAGIPGDDLIAYRSTDAVDAVLRPKVRGAFLLHRLTRDDRPDFVLHMSSVAAVFPALGQADYAAANLCLDQLARSLDEPEHRVRSVQWVAWRETGMAVAAGTHEDLAFKSLRTRTGLQLVDAALLGDRPGFFAGEVNYDSELMSVLPTYDVALSPVVAGKIETGLAALRDRLAEATERVRRTLDAVEVELTGRPDGGYSDRERLVARCVAHALGHPAIDVHADFRDLGGDSIMALTIGTNISAALGKPFDAIELMTERTVVAVARLIETRYDDAAEDEDDWLDDLLTPGA